MPISHRRSRGNGKRCATTATKLLRSDPKGYGASGCRSLGLERFEAAFRDNDIDQAVLRDLTDDHLREMGLTLGALGILVIALLIVLLRCETQRAIG